MPWGHGRSGVLGSCPKHGSPMEGMDAMLSGCSPHTPWLSDGPWAPLALPMDRSLRAQLAPFIQLAVFMPSPMSKPQ